MSFVCKKPKSGSWPSVTTTPKPVGYCSEGYHELEGHCYKLYDDQFKAWSDARQVCLDMGHGFDLASVNSDKEYAFLMTLIGNQNSSFDFWIGLNDIGEPGQYFWSDKSPIFKLFWAPGEPNGSYDNVSAVSGLAAFIFITKIAFLTE